MHADGRQAHLLPDAYADWRPIATEPHRQGRRHRWDFTSQPGGPQLPLGHSLGVARPTNVGSGSAVARSHRTTALGLIGEVERRAFAAAVAVDHDADVHGVHVLHDHRPVAEVKAGEVAWASGHGRWG